MNREWRNVRILWDKRVRIGDAHTGRTRDGYTVTMSHEHAGALRKKLCRFHAEVRAASGSVLVTARGEVHGQTRAREAALWAIRDAIVRDRLAVRKEPAP